MRALFLPFCLLSIILSTNVTAQAQSMGESGMPIPRFISISASEAFMRTGPGRQYPILWVYKRTFLPLKVVDEYGAWRQVVDHEGTRGWMHVSLLSNKRTVITIGGNQTLRSEASLSANVYARMEEGVISTLEKCEENWCQITHKDPAVTGWLPRAALFGVFENEVFN